MDKIIFVSDFFINELLGGAEKCNDVLVSLLQKHFVVEKRKSNLLTKQSILNNKGSFFIVGNFFNLSEECKKTIQNECRYLIYEHDHKYLSTNNPIKFKNFLAPTKHIINKEFFKNAQKVICQSKLHSETLYKNLLIDNIVNAGGNLWSQGDIQILQNYIDSEKTIEYATMKTQNKNKGMLTAIKFCEKNNYNLNFIPLMKYEEFIKSLSKVKNFVFFPQWLESYSRVAVESRILNCKLITNKLIGATSEEYFNLSGQCLLDKVIENNDILIEKIISIVNGKRVEPNFVKKEIPKITISCSLYDADKYISHFLEDIVEQTIFDKCELIIVNANSPGNEEEVIQKYCKKYENIHYHRLDHRATTTEAINMVIDELSTGEFITIGNVDDRRRSDCLEIQAKFLMYNDDIDLVYSDCIQTTKINETFDDNSSNGAFYEHSRPQFSKENMIKCLPGPMPMWKRSVHNEVGLFNHEYEYANDWDMWLRMVESGKKFLRIDQALGLYLFNEEGRSTSKETFEYKIKEEAKIFFRYKHIFGEENYNKYKNYFSQGLKNE